jgi:hypothetical protein
MISKQAFLVVVFLMACSSVYTQNSSPDRYVIAGIALPAEEPAILKPTPVVRVHIRAARDFSKRFRTTTANWRQSNDTTIARFTADSATTFVGYGKTGKWLYTVKAFGEWLIPGRVRHEVRSLYYDYRIDLAYELLFPGNTNKVYLFYMRDLSDNRKVIRWTEDGVQVVKSLNAQPGSKRVPGKSLNER